MAKGQKPTPPPSAAIRATAARPPQSPLLARRRSESTHYGSLQLSSAHLRQGAKPIRSPFEPPRPDRPPPVGPLARVPSNPSFVPVMAIDMDAVASQVSESVGAKYTTEELLSSLADSSSCGQELPSVEEVIEHEDVVWENTAPEEPQAQALSVVVAGPEALNFSDETLVLKIRPHDTETENDDIGDIETGIETKFGIERTEADATSGFAINIPVTHEQNPHREDAPSSWEFGSPMFMSDREYDEEAPLLEDTGLNMSYRSNSSIPIGGSAFVQRTGARNVAEEQEVLYAVPNADTLGSRTTGLFLPVMDSREDLTQLMFVMPPGSATPHHDEELVEFVEKEVPATTAETIRENVDHLAAQLPGIIDVESTLEVHGTAENATVAMNVTKQVSWVGYIILGIALVSVASQGTAVKWLPSVDGLVAAAWLMQAQTMLMIPFAIFQYCTLNQEEHEQLRKPSTLQRIIGASVAQVCWGAGFFLAIDYTLLFHAWSLNNIHALFIVLIAMFRKSILGMKSVQVSYGEVFGARVTILGVLLMQVPLLMGGSKKVLVGDIIAMTSSFAGILFLNLCKSLRKDVPLFLMMTPVTALNAILFSFGAMAINGTDLSLSDNGVLGWLQADRIALGLYLGGVVGFLGTICCIAALKFLPSVVVGSVQTMMPVVGTLVAVGAGVDTLPDFWSTVGGGVLLYGVLLIADATRQSEATVILNPHISEVGTTKAKS